MSERIISLPRCLAVSLSLTLALFVSRAQAAPQASCNIIFKAWVDPVNGADGALSVAQPNPSGWCAGPVFSADSVALQQLNDPTHVGFDERHGLISAGSWGNDSISHNAAPAGIQPNAPAGRARRYFIMPASVTNYTSLFGVVVAPAVPADAWSFPPPGALNPRIDDPLATQVDYKTQYVSLAGACPTPTPWPTGGAVVPNLTGWSSPVGAGLAFASMRLVDSVDHAGGPDIEGGNIQPCGLPDAPKYFCLQAIQHTVQGRPLTTKFWYSNLQFEYR